MVATDDDNLDLIEGEPEHLPRNNRPLSEGGSPEVGGITATDLHQFVAFFLFFNVSHLLVIRNFSLFFNVSHLLVILKLSPAKTPWGNTALSSLSI